MEGIYRLSGSATHISHMKAVFDNGESDFSRTMDISLTLILLDSSQVDFTNPENFYHDVNSVAGLAKQFFRDLPDPLFTSQFYHQFIDAARKSCLKRTRVPHTDITTGFDDDIQRRDSLHALINSLPDAHYATLRAIILV
jgi:hypothetical protein